MGVNLSPAVNVIEKDLSTTIPALATSITGMVGQFNWGPCNVRMPIIQERNLIDVFGYPDDTNYVSWYSAFNVLAYANILYIVRAVDEATAKNSGIKFIDDVGADPTPVAYNALKLNEDDIITPTFTGDEKLAVLAKYPSDLGNNYQVALCNLTDFATANIITGITFASQFEYAPESDQFCVVILDENDEILERHIVSTTEGAKDFEGNNIYVDEWINRRSKYIWMFDNTSNTNGVASREAVSLAGGVLATPTGTEVALGFDLYADPEEFDINIIIDGEYTDATNHGYIIDNVVDVRKDCVGILTVPKADVVGVVDYSTAVNNMITYRGTTLNKSSSYAALYGNWKYQYDKHGDKYRWLPISGDMAGIYAYTDYVSQPWMAPAGYNRGLMKNVKKLALSPKKGFRDQLYINQINPVYADRQDGPVVIGQKTLQAKPSAFDRVDNRRLFIVLEKSIATASKYFIMEKNLPPTRRRLKGMIDPFLRDVAGKEGLDDFLVVCDESNNTPEVRDRHELVCDIYIKPAMSAEYLNLNFIATKSGVDFKELVKAP